MTGWSSLFRPVTFSSDRQQFLVRAPVFKDEDHNSAIRQLVLVEKEEGKADDGASSYSWRPLHLDQIEAVDMVGWDEQKGRVYFMGIPSEAPSQRHLFSVNTDRRWQQAPDCITCRIQQKQVGGRRCLFNSVKLNPRYTSTSQHRICMRKINELIAVLVVACLVSWYVINCLYTKCPAPINSVNNKLSLFSLSRYVLECLGPDIPSVFLAELDPQPNAPTNSSSWSPVEVVALDLNSDLSAALTEMSRPIIRTLDVPAHWSPAPNNHGDFAPTTVNRTGNATGEGRTIRAKLYLPAHLNLHKSARLPVVLHV